MTGIPIFSIKNSACPVKSTDVDNSVVKYKNIKTQKDYHVIPTFSRILEYPYKFGKFLAVRGKRMRYRPATIFFI